MREVTLQQMLDARELRSKRQRQLLAQFHSPLVCFTMNIPGPVKNTPLIRRAFRYGCGMLEERLPPILHREAREDVTGCEAMYAVGGEALAVKALCTAIEDETALGRLFDMDVLDMNGQKLGRTLVAGRSRDCVVCGALGRGCASRRLHTVPELQSAVNGIMETHFAELDRDLIAGHAVQSLLEEVNTTPKPGLVDRRNNGSHRDMDISTFTASAQALEPYFQECVEIGQATQAHPSEETFRFLRQAGLRAEQAMYQATGGINTHKGAIYTMGILCGCLGRLWQAEEPIAGTSALLEECANMTAESAKADFQNIHSESATAGERLYQTHGLTGIRGEVAAGLPSVTKYSLPAFRDCLSRGMSRSDAGAIALLHLIAHVEDTNLYHRGGPEGAAWAQNAASQLLPCPAMARIEALDDAFIRKNLSPGGCADLLAVTYFLDALER